MSSFVVVHVYFDEVFTFIYNVFVFGILLLDVYVWQLLLDQDSSGFELTCIQLQHPHVALLVVGQTYRNPLPFPHPT